MLETVRTFTALSEEFVEESLRLWPVQATAAGIHDYDHLLPDDTPGGHRARSVWLLGLEQRLAASVPWEELPIEHRVDFALLRSRISVLRAGIEEMRTHARDPVACVRTALDGIFLLVVRPFASIEERKEAIIARLLAIPDYLAAALGGLEGAPRLWVDLAREVAGGGPILVNEVVRVLLRAFPREAERIEHAGFCANTGLAACREMLEREIGPRSGGGFALGARWLDFLLEREHMLPLNGEALERLARDHVALLQRQIGEEAKRIAPQRSAPEVIGQARRGRQDATLRLDAVERELARARGFVLESRLAPVPDVRLTLAEMPAYLRPLSRRVTYIGPAPFDVEPVGALLIGSDDAARPPRPAEPESGAGGLALTIACDGWPGRHLQGSHAILCGSRLRRLADNRLFADGWALYAEERMVEEGFAANPDARLALLLDRLLSASRAVVDVGMHGGRMDLAQAVDYLAREAMLDPVGALAEARRVSIAPSRALGGFVGWLQIHELRNEAERRLGEKYDRLDFHAALLAGGTLPPALIAEELMGRLGVG